MRLQPLSPDALPPELRSVHQTIVDLMVRRQPQIVAEDRSGALIGPFPAMLHFPAFGIPALRLLAAIGTEAKLPPLVREVVILTVGARLNARYELYAHEIMGAVAGLSAAEVALLAAGRRPPTLSDEAAIAHDVASALLDGRTLAASTFDRATALLGHDGLGELVFLMGGYVLIALVLNCFDMPVPDPAA